MKSISYYYGRLISGLGNRGFFHSMPDQRYLKIIAPMHTGKKLDLENPQTFTEKLQWLKLHNRKDVYTRMVDKYESANYLRETVGEGYSIPRLGVWEHFDDIDFDALPDQFVLKCTHDSRSVVICRDKSTFDRKKARASLERHLKRNLYYGSREWPYKNVPPRIMAEQLLVDESGTELKDYKVLCFNGRAEYVLVDFARFTAHRSNYYDRNFQPAPFGDGYNPADFNRKIKKPKMLDEMFRLAEQLSKDIPFLRVDFYSVYDKLYIGELTFFHNAGFARITPDQWEYKLGQLMDLSGMKD